MKNLPAIFICIILACVPLSFFIKNVYALERTINIEGVNYVSLTQMAKKYNLALSEEGGAVKLTGEAVNLVINVSSNLFTLNDIDFVAQELPQRRDNEVWITAKDWAGMFNLSLTNYDKVSQMDPVKSDPVSTEAELDTSTYHVDESYGEKVPESIRKHGNIKTIENAHIEQPIMEIQHYNKEKQDTLQRK